MKIEPTEYRFKAMGGEFQFFTYCTKYHKDELNQIFGLAQKEVERIENKLTDFKKSPFNLINENAGICETFVDDEIFKLIKKSFEFSKKSSGLFDISYASVGHLWREAKRNGKKLSVFDRALAGQYIDYKKIELNEQKKTVFLPHHKMRIGLGGLGKGYAVDRSFEVLLDKGLENFYVNGSGDIRVHSRHDAPRKWRFAIQNPFSQDMTKKIGVVQISQGSVSSSGGYVEKNKIESRKADHHILNPKNSFSNNTVAATSVYGNNALLSDTYATILMNMSPKKGIDFLDAESLSGLVVTNRGECLLSQRAIDNFGL